MQTKLQSNSRIFPFLYEVTQSTIQTLLLTQVLQVFYLIVLLFCFFIITYPSHQFSLMAVQTLYLPIFCGVLFLIIIIEIIVTYHYQAQYQLYNQLSICRYIAFPLLILFLASEIVSPYFLPNYLTSILLALVIIFALSLSRLIFQPNNIDRILQGFSCLQTYLIMTDILMILLRIATSNNSIWTIYIIWVILQFIMNGQRQNYHKSNGVSKILCFINRVKEFLLCSLIIKQIFPSDISGFVILLISWPTLLMMLAFKAIYSRKQQLNENIFAGKASLPDFFDFIRVMNDEFDRFKNNQDVFFQKSYIMVFIAIHNQKCVNSTCSLMQPSTAEELKNSSQPNNMKILMHKVKKSVQNLFQIYLQKQVGSQKLRLLFLYFYVYHLPNKSKISQLTHGVSILTLTWDEKLILYNLKRKFEKIQVVAQVIDTQRGEDEFQQFKQIMNGTLACLRQFWSSLLEEKVDLNHLMSIGAKLFPLKKQVQSTWKKHLDQEKFSSWNILRTYVLYRRNILHDYTNACILDDYCKIVQQRLMLKHEPGYINSETETGVIAISLTQSSLGNISSLNNQTCKMFNYPNREQVLELSVNAVMPSVYSQVHDQILSTYLKNRYKQINQDQRFIFGKNKNGFIFPMRLQLRNLSWNINDELIFIAHLQPAKLRAAPIYCISDLEGNIVDCTSTFASLFMKKIKRKSVMKKKNIQQLIPSFFQVIQNNDQQNNSQKFIFSQKGIINKNNQYLEVDFTAVQLYIKHAKIGFLIQGRNTYSQSLGKQKKNISNLLKSINSLQDVFLNIFNPITMTYEIPNNFQPMRQKSLKQQFTIPFFNSSDLQNIFNIVGVPVPQKKVYDLQIKTLRLFNSRLQKVNDESSFNSDEDNDEWRQKSVLTHIQKMKEELNVEESKNIGYYFRIVAIIITMLLVMLGGIIFWQLKVFENGESTQLNLFQYQRNIRVLFPQYLIYTLFPSSINNATKTKSIKTELVKNLINAQMPEWQKQEILKVVYDSQITTNLQIDSNILDFPFNNFSGQNNIIILWYAICSLQLLFMLVIMGMFAYYKYTMANIYIVLLDISDSKLHSIQQESQKLVELLNSRQSDKFTKQVPGESKSCVKEQQIEFKRVKKIKNSFNKQDLGLLSQMVVPIFLILIYLVLCTICIEINFTIYNNYTTTWRQASQLLPGSSISIMESILKYLRIGNYTLTNDYFQLQQQFQKNIFDSDFTVNNELLYLLKGYPCQEISILNEAKLNMTSICQNHTEMIQSGVMSALSYLTTIITNYQNQPSEFVQTTLKKINWSSLISLQFDFIKPLLKYGIAIAKTSIESTRYNLQNLIIILNVVAITFLIFVVIYLNCYPMRAITEKLTFTKDLVTIVPSDKLTMPKEALATLTTEALDYY